MFKNIFSSKKSEVSNKNRIALVDENQLEEIIKLSSHKTILIFKHSTRCGISSMILNRFESKISDRDYYLLDILNYRNISNLIADKFNIVHQSPQFFVIKEGKVIAHAAHSEILDIAITE